MEDIPQLPVALPQSEDDTEAEVKARRVIMKVVNNDRLSIEDEEFHNVFAQNPFSEVTELRRSIKTILTTLAFIPQYMYLYLNSACLFCSLPWRHPFEQGERASRNQNVLPKGNNASNAANRYWPFKPVFHVMDQDWPQDMFEKTKDALNRGLRNAADRNDEFKSLWKGFINSIPEQACNTEFQLRSSEEDARDDFQHCILFPFHKLTQLIGVDVKKVFTFELPPTLDDQLKRGRFYPDVSICYKGILTLPVAIKKMPLKAYLKDDGTLNLAEEKLLGIIEEEYWSMEMSGCEYGMVTDFDVVIVLKIDFETKEWKDYINSDEGKAYSKEYENLKNEILNFSRSYAAQNTEENVQFWNEMRKRYDKIKACVPISISVSRIGDTGYGSLAARFTALALREAIYEITGDEQDKPPSEEEKKERQIRLQRLTRTPSTFTKNASFEDAIKAIKGTEINDCKGYNERAIQISDGIYHNADGFEVLQDARYQRQVFCFTFAAYAKMIPGAREKMKWLKDDDKVILKVFNTSDADYQLRILKKEKEIDFDTTIDEYTVSIADTYLRELESHKLIQSYNEKHPDNQVHIPKLYDYGYMSMCKENKDMIDGYEFLFSGYFILTSYIKSQPNSVTQDSIDRCCEEMRIMSEEVEVQHNDVASRNVIVNQGNIYLIDFSHAKLYRSLFSLEEDQKNMRELGSKLLRELDNFCNSDTSDL